jgi:carbamoyltransferase
MLCFLCQDEFVGFNPDQLSGKHLRSQVDKKLPEIGTDSQADLFRVFLLGLSLDKALIEELLDPPILHALASVGILFVEENSLVRSLVQIMPVAEDLHIVADYFQIVRAHYDQDDDFEPVMYIGLDSRALVATVPRDERVGRVLDLCTGSGVQGLTAARYYADQVVFVDLNPRALRFTRFNAVLNGLEDETTQLTVVHGSLFDAITAENTQFAGIV